MAEALPPERMSRVDTAWLRMDNDVNLMMIVGVWLLEPALGIGALRQRIADKLLQYDRFRQRVHLDAIGAEWVDDEHFDIERHVVREVLEPLPGQSAREALQARCAELAALPLDMRHPLWQFHLVEHFDGGSAMIARVHHCIGDGIALISVMMSITDGGAGPPPRRRRAGAAAGAAGAAGAAQPADAEASASHGHGHGHGDGLDPAHAHDADWLAEAVLRPLSDITVKAIGMYGSGVARSMDALASPEAATAEVARAGYQVLSDAAALLLMPDDSHTPLKGKPSGRKCVAWSEPLPLDEVKAVGKALGCSVNDVLLACVAGAVGGWLRGRGHDPAGQAIRAMVPVNLRSPDKAWQLGNRFGLAPLVLPIGIENPIARVYDVHRRMAQMKGSYQPLLAFAVLAASGMLAKPLQDAVLGIFARKSTAVMTNVPGPREALRLCGSTLRQTMFWVPASGDIGVGVSVLSYAGGVQFGLITDAGLCPEPQAVIDRFQPEFEALLLLTLMLPWGSEAA